VKGHNDVPGNEAADALAKAASVDGQAVSCPVLLISYQHYKHKIRFSTDDIWQQEWNQSSKGRLTHSIFPRVPIGADLQILLDNQNNNIRSLVFQALTGHIPVNAYLSRFKLKPNEACEFCGASTEDVTHLLVYCARFSFLRFSFLSQKNLLESQLELSDYFKHDLLALAFQILRIRFGSQSPHKS
jgi:hypothetical protein